MSSFASSYNTKSAPQDENPYKVAYERVAEIIDNDEDPSEEEVEELFATIYDRPSDRDDRASGLWSLVVAGTPEHYLQ